MIENSELGGRWWDILTEGEGGKEGLLSMRFVKILWVEEKSGGIEKEGYLWSQWLNNHRKYHVSKNHLFS
jgi:hypothetical protein